MNLSTFYSTHGKKCENRKFEGHACSIDEPASFPNKLRKFFVVPVKFRGSPSLLPDSSGRLGDNQINNLFDPLVKRE